MRAERERFKDRVDAGQQLASRLDGYTNAPDTVVLGLARGGVPVAAAVASYLGLPLDVLIVRKLGVPGYPEVAFGAIASGGIEVLNAGVIRSAHIDESVIDRVRSEESKELARREGAYRGGRPALDLASKTAIVVDDGTATGATMHAAVEALRAAQPHKIVVAVGVAPPGVLKRLREVADEAVAVYTPHNFMAVGAWYNDFTQTTDAEVVAALADQ